MIKILDFVICWAMALIPFTMGINSGPMNVFMGLLIASFLLKKIIQRKPLFVNTPLNPLIALFFVISVISLFNSVSYRDSIRGLSRILYSASVFLILVEEVKSDRQIKILAIAMIAGVLLLSVDSLWQVVFGKDFIRHNELIINLGLKRATGSFPDANVLGIYLSALAPMAVVLLPLVVPLAALGLVLTYSRPTLLAFYLILLIFGLVRKNKLLIACLVIFTLLAPFILPRSIKDWAKAVNYNPLRFMCNDDRIAVYRNTLNMISHHPMIGVGVNNFMKNYKAYKEFPEYRNVVTADYMYAHNNFLHMAGEIGLIGLGVFLSLLYVLFKASSRIYRRLKDPFRKNVSLGLILCLVSFLVNGLTESSLYYSKVALLFWYLMGFSLALEKFVDEDKT